MHRQARERTGHGVGHGGHLSGLGDGRGHVTPSNFRLIILVFTVVVTPSVNSARTVGAGLVPVSPGVGARRLTYAWLGVMGKAAGR